MSEPAAKTTRCPRCHGFRTVRAVSVTVRNGMKLRVRCPKCAGTGRVDDAKMIL